MQILGIANSYASAPVNAPTSLSATPTNTDVSISFTAPTNDGGAAITNYEYSFNNSSWTALSPTDAASPVTVSGLTQNTSYTVYLRAVNIVGSGPGSTGVSFTTQGVPTSAPSGLSSIQTDTSVSISFTAAASSTSLTNYEYSFNNSTWTALSPADAVSPITISGLSQNTAYNVYLRGVNAYGSGPGSTATSFTTFGPPTGTTTISSVSVGTTTATVNFSTTAGGGAITGYDYYLHPVLGWTDVGVSSSPKSLSGLTPNYSYVVYMRPKNAYGIGPQSAGFSFTTNPVFMSATGGTTFDYASGGFTYRSHTFTGNGTFTVSTVGSFGTVDAVIVAGGGGGGGDRGGGGGAGGMQTTSPTLSAIGYSIGVGGGGAGNGGQGGNSSAFGVTSLGGGYAGYCCYANPNSGGSGGGCSANGGCVGGAGTSGQGNAGGNTPGTGWMGSGGGGKGAAGVAADGSGPAAGGTNDYRTGSNETYSYGGQGRGGAPFNDQQRETVAAYGSGGAGGASPRSGFQGAVIIRYRIA